MALTLLVLDGFRVLDGRRDVTPADDEQRRLLAAILLEAGTPLTTGTLVDIVRSGWLPADPEAEVSRRVSAAEAALGRSWTGLVDRGPGTWSVRRSHLRMSDADRLRTMTRSARLRLQAGDDRSAVRTLGRAGERLGGTPLAGLDGAYFDPRRDQLRALVADALAVLAEAVSRRPTPAAVDLLRRLSERHPAAAPVWLCRMTTEAAVHGRHAALAVYAQAQQALGPAFNGPGGTPLRQARAAIGRGSGLPRSGSPPRRPARPPGCGRGRARS